MNSSDEALLNIGDVLGRMSAKGVRLWSENGQLRYQAPKGVLSGEELTQLREFKGEIISILERTTGDVACGVHQRSTWVPLTFSQLMHWNFRRLAELPTSRGTASAIKLVARLNLNVFRQAIDEIIHRHAALRTRIVIVHGVPVQEISQSGNGGLEVYDLTTISESMREEESKRLINSLLFEPVQITDGPLWKMAIVRLGDDEHVMVMAMEHIVSDGFSLRILVRDLLTVYVRILRGLATSLPPLCIEFTDYVVQQRSQYESWSRIHGPFWEKLARYPRVRFPESTPAHPGVSGWGTVSIHIGKSLTLQLREWCRSKGTTLIMSVFTAYVALVLRWCEAPEIVVRYQSDGRTSPELENLVGFLASRLYIHVKLLDTDTFTSLLQQVTKEYCKAYEHMDYSHIETLVPPPDVTRNTCFNWMPEEAENNNWALDESVDEIICSPVSILCPESDTYDRDEEPTIFLFGREEEIVGQIGFSRRRLTTGTMDRFGKNLIAFVETLLYEPDRRVKDISMV